MIKKNKRMKILNKLILKSGFHYFYALFFIFSSCKKASEKEVVQNYVLKPMHFSYQKITGIGLEKGVTRRDPSDVIKEKGVCYVYYTKVIGRAPGYWGDIWYAKSKDNGNSWVEVERVLGIGKEGAFDSQAVFTPNIIKANGKYYMYYTGVKPTPGRTDGFFENNSSTDITALGLAVSDKPGGPFNRVSTDPVLKISVEPEKFDSYRIDDASLLYKNGKYWLYYKGRSRTHKESGPAHTQMGVAFSNSPEGPFVKHPVPILSKSHEVMIWKQNVGIAALASISSTIEYSKNGMDFTSKPKNIKVKNRPNAPGAYREDLTGGKADGVNWGISMVHNGASCYLIKYTVSQ